mgnify:CR=1 FL=1|jgi:hypothetical protein|tara:strand:+ start:1351 stop:1911 length:561 start_codon:yes stop_codon:yes gene_type:complete
MGRVIDALIAYRLLKLLVTPFKKTKAYKLGIVDEKGKVLIKSKDFTKSFASGKREEARKSYTLLIRFVFNLKRILSKVGIRGALGSAAAAAVAFFREQNDYNPIIEKEVYKYIKEQGFKFDINENYGELLSEGKYTVKRDVYDLEGDIVINSGEVINFKEQTDMIMGYDVFKYKNTYLTTEDLNEF